MGQFPPYWWLRRLRRRGRDKLVNYGHCSLSRSMWFVSEEWNVEEAVNKARHRPWCFVKLSRTGAVSPRADSHAAGMLTGRR